MPKTYVRFAQITAWAKFGWKNANSPLPLAELWKCNTIVPVVPLGHVLTTFGASRWTRCENAPRFSWRTTYSVIIQNKMFEDKSWCAKNTLSRESNLRPLSTNLLLLLPARSSQPSSLIALTTALSRGQPTVKPWTPTAQHSIRSFILQFDTHIRSQHSELFLMTPVFT